MLGIALPAELPWIDTPYLSTLLRDDFIDAELIPNVWMIVGLMVLGLLGLRLPNGPSLSKWAYIMGQFGVIFLSNLLGRSIVAIPLLVVVVRSCVLFPRQGRWWVSGLAMGLTIAFLKFHAYDDIQAEYLASLKEPPMTLEQFQVITRLDVINEIVFFALILAFVLILVNTLLAECRSRQQLTAAHKELRYYAARIEDQAMLQERNRIARDIHDAVGHNLAALRIQLENVGRFCPTDSPQDGYLQTAQQLAAKALTEIRQSVATLRADPLQGKPLRAALESLCHTVQPQLPGTLTCDLQIPTSVNREIGAMVYRLAQEALTNILKHSQATQIQLRIQSPPGALWLIVDDNGVGFDPTLTTAGVGLKSMQERAEAIGGQLQIVTVPGQGCQITAKLPLKAGCHAHRQKMPH